MIKKTVSDGIAVLTLNRPEKRNALNPEMVASFISLIDECSDDNEIGSIIITGEGKAFCAGADLEYLAGLIKNSVIENKEDSKNISELFLKLYEFPKPVIAAVNGPAIAGGCGIVSVCDFVAADRNFAKFGYSEVKIGFIPAIVSLFLIRRIGEGKAKQLLLSGEIIEAEKAYQIGLADYLSDNSLQTAMELAQTLKNNSLLSMVMTKKIAREVNSLSIHQALEYCIQLNTISRNTEDFKNRINSFLKK